MFDWFFFFKQKTAYEMRISDWSSDVCSSDLNDGPGLRARDARLRDRTAATVRPRPRDGRAAQRIDDGRDDRGRLSGRLDIHRADGDRCGADYRHSRGRLAGESRNVDRIFHAVWAPTAPNAYNVAYRHGRRVAVFWFYLEEGRLG